MAAAIKQFYEFADYRLDVVQKVLLKDRKPVPVRPKAFDLLLILIENAGQIVEKDDLMSQVWSDSFVEESNLTFTVRQLRKTLGDDSHNPKFIETVPKRGYRFIADVSEVAKHSDVPIGRASTAVPAAVSHRYILWTAGFILVLGLVALSYRFVSKSPGEPGQPKFTRLTSTGKVSNAAISRDAKYIVFSQKEKGGESLWLRQILTGSQTQVLSPRDVEFTGLSITPDNEFIYCSVFFKDKVDAPLWRMPLLGGAIEEMPSISTGISVSFAPDGKRFAYIESFAALRETHLKISEADGSNQKVLMKASSGTRNISTFHANPVAWSPDGQFIACAVEESDENGSFSRVLLIDPRDGSNKYISENRWDHIENVAWIDNSSLAVAADDADLPTSHVWAISRDDGSVRQLTADLNRYGLVTAANGNLLAIQTTTTSSLQIADLDPEARLLKPRKILGESGVIDNVAWSPLNEILYSSRASGKNEVWRIAGDGTDPRRLTTDAGVTYGFTVSPLDATIVFSSARKAKNSLWMADADGQNIRELTDGTEDVVPNFTADGQTVIFQRGYGMETPSIYRVSVRDNQKLTKLTDRFSVHPTVSPDGSKTAFHFMDSSDLNDRKWRIGIISTETGQLTSKFDLSLPSIDHTLRWTPDGNFLSRIVYDGEQANFVLLPLNGAPEYMLSGTDLGKISSFAWSPDGKNIAFAQTIQTRDAILLSDF
jgi:DNA-binding winged helix-turn-helix (wHTH) protein/Tol biopolymer transport system component